MLSGCVSAFRNRPDHNLRTEEGFLGTGPLIAGFLGTRPFLVNFLGTPDRSRSAPDPRPDLQTRTISIGRQPVEARRLGTRVRWIRTVLLVSMMPVLLVSMMPVLLDAMMPVPLDAMMPVGQKMFTLEI